jgi:hypothetical protein
MRDTRRADDAAVLHHTNPIREIKSVMNIVADKENADTFGFELLDERADPRRFLRSPHE